MKVTLFNSGAVLGVLGLASLGALWSDVPAGEVIRVDSARARASAATVIDARNRAVPTGTYHRIISLNIVADAILLEMVEPDRLVAVNAYTLDKSPSGYRFRGRVGISKTKDIEPVIALNPDLVIVSKFADEAYIARLHERGIAVFDLGEMRGVRDTMLNIKKLATVLNVAERGRRITDRFRRHLQALKTATATVTRPHGLYLTIYGDTLFGGTQGTSYADLLRYGGVRDLAAERGFTGWPRYSAEQLLDIDPPLIVTARGRRSIICRHAILSRLSACRTDRVVELPKRNISDPGLGLVDAAEDLQLLLRAMRSEKALR